MAAYPNAAGTLSNDVLVAQRFMKSPTAVQRLFEEKIEDAFLADAILSGRAQTDSGAITYEVDEDQFAIREPESVKPGAEYPLTSLGGPSVQHAAVVKWGLDTLVTDESISRSAMSPVDSSLTKLRNSVVRKVDSVAMSLVGTLVTQTQAASAPWTGASANALLDILLADSKIEGHDRGYSADTIVVSPVVAAHLSANVKVLDAQSREGRDNAFYTGVLGVIAGKTIMRTNHLPAGVDAILLDRNALGGIADESLIGEGYAGAPVQFKQIREDATDEWRLRARRVCVPYINNPLAAVKITGVVA